MHHTVYDHTRTKSQNQLICESILAGFRDKAGISGKTFLDLLPDAVTGFVRGLKQLLRLICDILQIANQGGAVFARL